MMQKLEKLAKEQPLVAAVAVLLCMPGLLAGTAVTVLLLPVLLPVCVAVAVCLVTASSTTDPLQHCPLCKCKHVVLRPISSDKISQLSPSSLISHPNRAGVFCRSPITEHRLCCFRRRAVEVQVRP